MKIGIDIGYGYTKAVNENGQKISFPSLVAPSGPDYLKGVFSAMDNYQVEITTGRQNTHLFVGEAARSSYAVSRSLARDKLPELHDPLLLTAAALLGGEDRVLEIGVGLPLAYYVSQKDSLQVRLQSLAAHVKVNGNKKYVGFPLIKVIPQGAGVLFLKQDALPRNGFVGVVDIGTYTTEYLLFEIREGRPVPVMEASGSVEAGVHLVNRAIAAEFQTLTGSPLPLEMEKQVIGKALNGEPVRYYNKDYLLEGAAITARKNIAMVITQKVISAWGNRTGYIEITFLAGGGPGFFGPDINSSLPNALAVEDAFYANANGYLAFL